MKISSFILMLLATIFFFGCTKPGVDKTVDHMLITGDVLLVDEANLFVDKSGMTVTVEGSNPSITATTDANGEFKLTIPCSVKSFALVYSKSAYGTFKRFFEMRGDSLFRLQGEFEPRETFWGTASTGYTDNESLGYKSTVTVNSLTSSMVNGKLKIVCNVSSPNIAGEKFIRFFYSKSLPNISFNNVPKIVKNMGMPIAVKNGDNVFDMCMSCLYQCADMKSGETVYITAYGDGFYANLYTDKPTGTFMMPNVNLSNHVAPVSITLP
jgi:hypothetical protein